MSTSFRTRAARLRSAGSIALSAALAATATFAVAAPSLAINGGACRAPYALSVEASDFTDASDAPNAVDNPWFPLEPGTTFTYEGFKDGAPLMNVVTVTGDTRSIMGVTATVVRDTAYSDGTLAEDTFDWYAQDDAGNVWYFGEDTTEYNPDGTVDTKFGSWEAGQGDNLPGILMLARPRSGTTYRQEFGPGVAIDMATVLSRKRHVTVPYGSFGRVVLTKEFSCLEQGGDHKWYAPGVGLVQETGLSAAKEHIELVSVTR